MNPMPVYVYGRELVKDQLYNPLRRLYLNLLQHGLRGLTCLQAGRRLDNGFCESGHGSRLLASR